MDQINPAILQGSETVKCSECGGIFFKQESMLQKVSKFKVGAPTDLVIPMTIHRCTECGTPITEELELINQIIKKPELPAGTDDNVKSLKPKNPGLILT